MALVESFDSMLKRLLLGMGNSQKACDARQKCRPTDMVWNLGIQEDEKGILNKLETE
jgi:hypothetical protein